MLAGEPFSDQPASVSPVVAAFLRAYNDAASEEQRQGLYPYAVDALGTRAPTALERQRARLCLRRLRPRATVFGRYLQLAVALVRPTLVAATLGRAASHADASRGTQDGLRVIGELIAVSGNRADAQTGNGSDLPEVVGIG